MGISVTSFHLPLNMTTDCRIIFLAGFAIFLATAIEASDLPRMKTCYRNTTEWDQECHRYRDHEGRRVEDCEPQNGYKGFLRIRPDVGIWKEVKRVEITFNNKWTSFYVYRKHITNEGVTCDENTLTCVFYMSYKGAIKKGKFYNKVEYSVRYDGPKPEVISIKVNKRIINCGPPDADAN